MKILTALFLSLVLFINSFAQNGWAVIGIYGNYTVEVSVLPGNELAKTRHRCLVEKCLDEYFILTWRYSCEKKTAQLVNSKLYNGKDELLKDEEIDGDVLKVEKGSLAEEAFKYWCK